MKTKLFVIAAILFVPLLSEAGKRRWQSDAPQQSIAATGIKGRFLDGNGNVIHESSGMEKPHGADGLPLPPPVETTRKVVQLPEYGDHWWTTLILDSKWQTLPNQRKAQSMMTHDAACAELMASTKGRIITTDTPIARPYFKYITGTPCLVIQNPEGQVIYSEVNPDLGKRPRELINEINQTMRRKRHCDGNVCPVVEPEPKPVDDQGPKDVPAVSPGPADVTPEVKKHSSAVPALIAFIVCGMVAYALRCGVAARGAVA